MDESDLATHAALLVIQPADRPLVTDIGFEGNSTISAQAIKDRVLKLIAGNSFSERDFRRILDLNVRPMFEEKGILQVTFPAVRTVNSGDAKVAVTTAIEEGRVWQLGAVSLGGDELPADRMLAAGGFATGRVANWTEFLANVAKMEFKVLKT